MASEIYLVDGGFDQVGRVCGESFATWSGGALTPEEPSLEPNGV